MGRQHLRWIGVVGIVAAVVILVTALLAGTPPDLDDPAAEIREYLVDERDMVLVSSLLSLLVFPLVAWFIVSLRRVLALRDRGPWPTILMLSTFALGSLVLAANAVGAALVYEESFIEGASEDVVLLGWYTANLFYAVGTAAFVAILGSFGISALRGRLLPAWLGWGSLVLAAVAVVGTLSVLDSGMIGLAFIAFLGFVLWMLATAVFLLVASRRSEHVLTITVATMTITEAVPAETANA